MFYAIFKTLENGGTKTKAGYKRDVSYFHITYDTDQVPTQFPENHHTPLVPLTAPVLMKADYRIAPPTVSFNKQSIWKSLLSKPFTARIPL